MHGWPRWMIACGLGLWLLAGCDAFDNTPGKAQFLLTWPRSSTAQSVRVQLLQEDRVVKSQLVNRIEGQWQVQLAFDNLATQDTYFIATLYEHPDGVGSIHGIAQGKARVVRKNVIPHVLTTDLAPDARVEIYPEEPVVYLDDTLQLVASVRNPDNAWVILPAGSITWRVSDSGIAEIIASNGLVTGIAQGQTTVTATAGTLSGQTLLQVKYPPPTVDLTANDTEIDPGEAVRLSWTSTNATRVESAVNFNTALLNGNQTVYPEETTEYKITVRGPGGTATDSVTVKVNVPVPVVNLQASQTYVTKGTPVVLTWTSQYGTSVYSSSNFSANGQLNGTVVVTPEVTTTYTITIQGPSGMNTASVTVVVVGM